MKVKVEKSWKSLVASCRIPARAKSASVMLDRHCKKYYADSVDPVKFKCSDCGQEDERLTTNRDEWAQITCSNCYSKSVLIVGIRLTFFDWVEQNGGKEERDDRFSFAEETLRDGGGLMDREHSEDDFDSDDGLDPEEEEDFFDCGWMREGGCSMAGSEECDFECPNRDSMIAAMVPGGQK